MCQCSAFDRLTVSCESGVRIESETWRSWPQLLSIHMKESKTRVTERIASGRAISAATRAIEEEEDSPSLAHELSPGDWGTLGDLRASPSPRDYTRQQERVVFAP